MILTLRDCVLLYILSVALLNGCGKVPERGDVYGARWESLRGTSITGTVPVATLPLFFDATNGLAIQGSTVERSSDGGRTWMVIHAFEGIIFDSLYIEKDSTVWVMGAEFSSSGESLPVVFTSNDKGSSWNKLALIGEPTHWQSSGSNRYNSLCFDVRGQVWISSDFGILKGRRENHNLLIDEAFESVAEVLSISCALENNIWATGRGGYVYFFREDWQSKQLAPDANFTRIILIEGDVWLLGIRQYASGGDPRGIVLQSKDGGGSWTEKAPASSVTYGDLLLRDGVGWLVGSDGRIFHTENDGHTWEEYPSPTTNNLEVIFSLDSKKMWIGGINQTILKYRGVGED